jgi:hypothetical protein
MLGLARTALKTTKAISKAVNEAMQVPILVSYTLLHRLRCIPLLTSRMLTSRLLKHQYCSTHALGIPPMLQSIISKTSSPQRREMSPLQHIITEHAYLAIHIWSLRSTKLLV